MTITDTPYFSHQRSPVTCCVRDPSALMRHAPLAHCRANYYTRSDAVPICRANGYGLLADVDGDGLYEYWARFDEVGKELTLAWLDTQVGDYQGVFVTVEAQGVDAAPDADEMLFLSVTAFRPAEPGELEGDVIPIADDGGAPPSQGGAPRPEPAPAPGPAPSPLPAASDEAGVAMMNASFALTG